MITFPDQHDDVHVLVEGRGIVAALDAADLIAWGAIIVFLLLVGALSVRYPGFRRLVDRSAEVSMRLWVGLLLFFLALLPGWGLYALASLAPSGSLWVGVPVFALLAGAVALLFWILFTDDKRRRLFDRAGRVASGFAIPTVLSWTFLSAALGLFGSLTFVLYQSGAVQLEPSQGSGELRSGHVVDFYLWHFLESVPLLRVTETLRWDLPVTYEAPRVGWLLLAFKLFVILPVIGIFRSYWQYRKQRVEGRREPEEDSSAIPDAPGR